MAKQIYVSHGRVTHKIDDACKSCEKSLKEFNKAMAEPNGDAITVHPITVPCPHRIDTGGICDNCIN